MQDRYRTRTNSIRGATSFVSAPHPVGREKPRRPRSYQRPRWKTNRRAHARSRQRCRRSRRCWAPGETPSRPDHRSRTARRTRSRSTTVRRTGSRTARRSIPARGRPSRSRGSLRRRTQPPRRAASAMRTRSDAARRRRGGLILRRCPASRERSALRTADRLPRRAVAASIPPLQAPNCARSASNSRKQRTDPAGTPRAEPPGRPSARKARVVTARKNAHAREPTWVHVLVSRRGRGRSRYAQRRGRNAQSCWSRCAPTTRRGSDSSPWNAQRFSTSAGPPAGSLRRSGWSRP